eukprot:1160146-Pelagomonas_calceolata.AAC.5
MNPHFGPPTSMCACPTETECSSPMRDSIHGCRQSMCLPHPASAQLHVVSATYSMSPAGTSFVLRGGEREASEGHRARSRGEITGIRGFKKGDQREITGHFSFGASGPTDQEQSSKDKGGKMVYKGGTKSLCTEKAKTSFQRHTMKR